MRPSHHSGHPPMCLSVFLTLWRPPSSCQYDLQAQDAAGEATLERARRDAQLGSPFSPAETFERQEDGLLLLGRQASNHVLNAVGGFLPGHRIARVFVAELIALPDL